MKNFALLLILLALAASALSGCATRVANCVGDADTPQYHYLVGMKALEEGKTAVAQDKFGRAIYCNDEFSRAYAGLAIAGSETVKTQSDNDFSIVEVERVRENMKNAKQYAEQPEDYFDYYLAGIRSQTAMKTKDWLSEAESYYRDSMNLKIDERNFLYYQGREAATYFIGMAYLESLEFTKARGSFAAVLSSKSDGKWHGKADKSWKRADRIVRAMAGITIGDIGRKIAVKDSVNRADLAALLMAELKTDKLMAGRIFSTEMPQAEFIPADMLNHPYKDEVLTLLKWKVRGLEPKADETTKAYLFKSADPVTRGELALILEDVLIKLTGDEKLATAYLGQERSPFPDVKPTSPFYNAVMNMTTRNILEGELSGEFKINEPVDGAEALLAIRVLKQKVNIY